MRKVFIFTLLILGFQTLDANVLNRQYEDVITLNNSLVFKGKIAKIRSCKIVFKTEKGKFNIPITDIYEVSFSEKSESLKNKFKAYQNDPQACEKGVQDAQDFHRKGGIHFALGVLFGPFTVIGAAIANPTPLNGKMTPLMSQNKDLFSDPIYLTCYKKKAKGKNVLNATLGWAAIVVVLLAIGD